MLHQAGCKNQKTEELFQHHTDRCCWLKSGSQLVPARSPDCHLALGLAALYPHPPSPTNGALGQDFGFSSGGPTAPAGERRVGGPGASDWLTHPALADEAATRLFNPRLCPKQDFASKWQQQLWEKTPSFLAQFRQLQDPTSFF